MLSNFPKADLVHRPTPIEELAQLSNYYHGPRIFVKRDDCTGLAMGGNKARQLEFYFGEALQQGADTILITGAVQSNYMRMAAAAANKLSMQCHLQLEHRVDNNSEDYQTSGNVLLDQLLGAHLHYYPLGEDEHGADSQLKKIAQDLKKQGKKPYIIPLAPGNPPKGALGYVDCAIELTEQCETMALEFNAIITPTGSGFTHVGLLTGLRALGDNTQVIGACVRRSISEQIPRVFANCKKLSEMIGKPDLIKEDDIHIYDDCLAPGYGQFSEQVLNTIKTVAQQEGLFIDPVYSGKTFALMETLIKQNKWNKDENILILHTGGTPAIFAYKNNFGFNV